MKLVLFDIDGTILKSRGVGRVAVREAIERVCGRDMHSAEVSFAGRTDPQIMRDLLAGAGCAEAEIVRLLPECLEMYVKVLMRRLTPDLITVLPGVRNLVDSLSRRDDIALGLLTGNLMETAYLKLHAAGLGSYFRFGAFGSDMANRYHLPEVAAQRAFAGTGENFEASRTVIIGDTPHDIGCANEFGAASVGVCTGSYSRQELSRCGPRILLDDLSDATEVFGLLDEIDRAA